MNMLRYTRNKYRKESISAKLIEKKRVSILLFLEKCQVQDAFYELIFMTEEGMKLLKLVYLNIML